jgi:pyruvate kinase
MKRTKIICTIGPDSINEVMLLRLFQEGMNIARLNGSHANLEWHQNAIKLIQKTLPSTPILFDIPGRKIRTGQLAFEPDFIAGDTVILTTENTYSGTEKITVNYAHLHEDLAPGNVIMADDGTLKFTVTRIEGRDIYCLANCSGKLKSCKGINVPFVKLNTPIVTPRDKSMVDFACDNHVDFIGLSFVESSGQVNQFKELINGRGPRIVAKVENQGGMDSVLEIAKVSDVIMIDRGDLSVETSLYDVALRQKEIIKAANNFGTPVIVATEMLNSMILSPFPTKAELTDIANAVLDGASCTMLSGETAVGAFPEDSVSTMRKVIVEAEKYHSRLVNDVTNPSVLGIPEAITEAIPTLCKILPITKVVAITRSGYAARMLSRHSIDQEIIAVSDEQNTAKSFEIISGVTGVFYGNQFSKKNTDHFVEIIKMLFLGNYLQADDTILITGVMYPQPGSRMNSINIFAIKDLINLFEWQI